MSDWFDFSIYVDADEADIERWYVERFFALRETAFSDETSFFRHFAALSDDELRGHRPAASGRRSTARTCVENILPSRSRADLVLDKGQRPRGAAGAAPPALNRRPRPPREDGGMRDWVVGGALILSDDGVLLVQNRRRNGSHDWTPPGGVIDEGETLLDGLTREVEEETGLRVTEWAGPSTRCAARPPTWAGACGSRPTVAVAYEGELHIDDPDGIVVDARFVDVEACGGLVDGGHPWVCEPLGEWLAERWDHGRAAALRVPRRRAPTRGSRRRRPEPSA